MITAEEFKFLDQFKDEFDRVLDSQYKLPSPQSRDEKILEIIRKYYPGYSHKWGCSVCAFNLYKTAGQMYREYLNRPKTKKTRKSSTKEEEQS